MYGVGNNHFVVTQMRKTNVSCSPNVHAIYPLNLNTYEIGVPTLNQETSKGHQGRLSRKRKWNTGCSIKGDGE